MNKIKLLVEIDEEDYGDFCDWFESVPSNVDGLPCVKGKFNTALYDAKPYDDSGDLISREALRKNMEFICMGIMAGTELYNAPLTEIDNAPTVEPEIPQGEWINHRNDYGHNIADCSLCGKAMQWHDEDENGIPRYCWYCGAVMKKGGAE